MEQRRPASLIASLARVRPDLGVAVAAVGVCCLGWVLLLPRTTVGLQDGDSGEFATALVRGSLVHPPGFPLYTLLLRALGAFHPENPLAAIATLSAILQGLAAGLVVIVCRAYGAGTALAAACGVAWLVFAPTVYTGTDVDVFAFHHVMLGIVLLMAAAVIRRASDGRVCVLGLIFGLSGTAHPISVLALPAVVGAIWVARTALRDRVAGIGLAGIAGVVGMLVYLSLFFDHARAPAIAFGSVDSLDGLRGHLFRDTFNGLNANANEAGERQLIPFVQALAASCPMALFGLALAGLVLVRQRVTSSASDAKHTRFLSWLLAAAASNLWLYWKFVLTPGPDDTHVMPARLFPTGLLIFWVTLAAASRFLGPVMRMMLVAAVVIPAVVAAPHALDYGDARRDPWADLYLHTVVERLPQDAIFLASSDVGAFGAIYWQALGHRPDVRVIVTGRLRANWYRRQLVDEPFLAGVDFDALKDAGVIARAAIAAGRPVVGEHDLRLGQGLTVRPQGGAWRWYPSDQAPPLHAVAAAVAAQCRAFPIPGVETPAQRVHGKSLRGAAFGEPLLRLAGVVESATVKEALKAAARAVDAAAMATARDTCLAAVHLLLQPAPVEPP